MIIYYQIGKHETAQNLWCLYDTMGGKGLNFLEGVKLSGICQ